jgi:hypothetical protein
MIGDEMLLLAAALVLLFALPLALLAWMAAQYAQMRHLAARLDGLEVAMRDLRERARRAAEDSAADGDAAGGAGMGDGAGEDADAGEGALDEGLPADDRDPEAAVGPGRPAADESAGG